MGGRVEVLGEKGEDFREGRWKISGRGDGRFRRARGEISGWRRKISGGEGEDVQEGRGGFQGGRWKISGGDIVGVVSDILELPAFQKYSM